MIWILHARFTEGRHPLKKVTKVFHQVCAEIKHRTPFALVRIDEIQRKSELWACVNDIQKQGIEISEWHFVGHGMPYGPILGSPDWPEAISASEWESLQIPFAAEARAWFYMESSAMWLAPFIATRYGIVSFGCDRLPKTNFLGMRAFPSGFWSENADYDDVASLYAETFADITVRRDECDWIERKITQFAPGKVLDIGCGNGALLAHLAPNIKQGVGVDISSAAIEIAAQNYSNLTNLSFVAINGPHLPFDDHSFNLIVSMLSFRYLDWDPVLQEMKRILAPGSHILIVDMVASSVRLREFPHLIADKLANLKFQRKNKRFAKTLSRLVTHPAWQKMLNRHPMRLQSEFIWYLKSRFPQGEMIILNTGLRAKILAFDSGPVNC